MQDRRKTQQNIAKHIKPKHFKNHSEETILYSSHSTERNSLAFSIKESYEDLFNLNKEMEIYGNHSFKYNIPANKTEKNIPFSYISDNETYSFTPEITFYKKRIPPRNVCDKF